MRNTVLFSLFTEGLKIHSCLKYSSIYLDWYGVKLRRKQDIYLSYRWSNARPAWNQQDFHPLQHDILCSVPRMSAIKKTCLRAGRKDNRGATRRRGRLFSSQQCLDQVWGAPRHLQGALTLCRWATHVHQALKDKTGILPLLVRTPLWYGAWLSTIRTVPFS